MTGADGRLCRIFGPYGVLKALEWGFARDRSSYTWLGFDKAEVVQPEEEEQTPSSSGAETEGSTALNASSTTTALETDTSTMATAQQRRGRAVSLPTPPDSPTLGPSLTNGHPSPSITPKKPTHHRAPSVGEPDIGTSGKPAFVKRLHTRFNASHSSPLSIALDGLHLLTSMRGIGYSFGPPIASLAPTPPKGRWQFARRTAWRFVRSHVISTCCLLILMERHRRVPALLSLVSGLDMKQTQAVADVMSYIAVGVSLHAQMLVGFEGAKLVFLGMDYLPLPEKVKPTWDAREWPDLFYRPFEPVSVTVFWSQQ